MFKKLHKYIINIFFKTKTIFKLIYFKGWINNYLYLYLFFLFKIGLELFFFYNFINYLDINNFINYLDINNFINTFIQNFHDNFNTICENQSQPNYNFDNEKLNETLKKIQEEKVLNEKIEEVENQIETRKGILNAIRFIFIFYLLGILLGEIRKD